MWPTDKFKFETPGFKDQLIFFAQPEPQQLQIWSKVTKILSSRLFFKSKIFDTHVRKKSEKII
jgi:hypothetical protein